MMVCFIQRKTSYVLGYTKMYPIPEAIFRVRKTQSCFLYCHTVREGVNPLIRTFQYSQVTP